jgi:hypothetical protein
MNVRKERPGCIALQMKFGTLCGRLTCDMMIELRGFVIAAAQTQADPSRNNIFQRNRVRGYKGNFGSSCCSLLHQKAIY